MRLLAIMICALSAAGWARDWRHVEDEAEKNLPPNVKWYLEQRDKHRTWQDKLLFPPTSTDSNYGLKLIGKWGRGPANKVTGRDSLVFLSLGSEVATFNVVDGHDPRVISEIQCRNITGRLCLKDSFLFVGANGPVEVYSIANPAQPRLVCYAPVVGAEVSIQDTLAFVMGIDSLFIFNVSNPMNWLRLGATRDSGYSLNVADGFAYLADRWGLYIVDCTDPANPHRASTLSGGVEVSASWAESGYCYYTESYPSTSFVVANVSDPYHPSEVGRRAGLASYDLYKLDYLVYLAGFAIVDVSTPGSPGLVGSLGFPGFGIWTRSAFGYSFEAGGSNGFGAINISDPVHPLLDTTLAAADISLDVCTDGLLGFVANEYCGMKVLDLTNASMPMEVGSYDSAGQMPNTHAVSARDSFAYLVNQIQDGIRVIDVSTPSDPRLEGVTRIIDLGNAAVLRDSLFYVAEEYHFEIFSIANPIAPRLVGSCGLPDNSLGLTLKDSLAYVANLYTLEVVSIANPTAPVVVGSCGVSAEGVQVADSVAYVAAGPAGFYTVNVADSRNPQVIQHVPGYSHDVAVNGSMAYVGGGGWLHALDVTQPDSVFETGLYGLPAQISRVFWADSLIYVCCNGAGMFILERIPAGIEEPDSTNPGQRGNHITLWPNPAGDEVAINLGKGHSESGLLTILDVTGRKVRTATAYGESVVHLDLRNLHAGAYFVVWKNDNSDSRVKLVKR